VVVVTCVVGITITDVGGNVFIRIVFGKVAIFSNDGADVGSSVVSSEFLPSSG